MFMFLPSMMRSRKSPLDGKPLNPSLKIPCTQCSFKRMLIIIGVGIITMVIIISTEDVGYNERNSYHPAKDRDLEGFDGVVVDHNADHGVRGLTLKGLLSVEEARGLLTEVLSSEERWDRTYDKHDEQYEDSFSFNTREDIYQKYLSKKIRSALNIIVDRHPYLKPNFSSLEHSSVQIRRYSPGRRKSQIIHHDMAEVSLTLALNSKDWDYKGGDLYFYDLSTSLVVQKTLKAFSGSRVDQILFRGRLGELLTNYQEANLKIGDAFIFDSRTLHGVQEIHSGERYVFIMFIKPDESVGNVQAHNEEKFSFEYEEGWGVFKGKLWKGMGKKIACKTNGVAGVDVLC